MAVVHGTGFVHGLACDRSQRARLWLLAPRGRSPGAYVGESISAGSSELNATSWTVVPKHTCQRTGRHEVENLAWPLELVVAGSSPASRAQLAASRVFQHPWSLSVSAPSLCPPLVTG